MALLRNREHDADDGGCGSSANISSSLEATISSERLFSPNKMPARKRRGRNAEGICHSRSITIGDSFLSRNGRFSGRTETGFATDDNRDERISAAQERCTRNGDWLHHHRDAPYSHSSLSFHDNLDWPILVFILALLITVTDACSTRPSPKPRPPRPGWSPDLGFGVVKENCTDDYAELYCMNGGKCYRQKILESFIVNCECQPGFVGKRCEYRDDPNKFLPSHQRIETASIAGGVTVLIIIISVFCLFAWYYVRRRRVFTHLGSSSVLSAGHV